MEIEIEMSSSSESFYIGSMSSQYILPVPVKQLIILVGILDDTCFSTSIISFWCWKVWKAVDEQEHLLFIW